MKRLSVIIFLLIIFNGILNAVDMIYLYPGSRPNSIGTAFSSIADDAYTIFYNPAGLTSMKNVQIAGGLGRRFSPLAPAGELSAVYIRPIPDKKNQVAGIGYYGIRQSSYGSRDLLIAGLGDSFVLKNLQKPIAWGANFRIISLRDAENSHFGIGFDGGVIFDSVYGLKTAVVLSDMDFGLGKSLLTFTLGNSYRRKNTTFSADLRVRGGYSEFSPGIEHNFLNGLLQIRAGKGTPLNGTDYLNLGLGINTSPYFIDVSASIPWAGLNEKAGHYEFNVGYKFNAPSFNEKLIGDASTKAETLKTQIEDLRQQRARLETQIATYQVNKGILETELTTIQSRMRDMESRLKAIELDILNAEYRKGTPPPKKIAVPVEEKWPKEHRVEPEDTLRSIAAKYYGNPNLWELIYEANTNKIKRGLPIEGSILEIPAPKQQ
jgi:LysM repeat protein